MRRSRALRLGTAVAIAVLAIATGVLASQEDSTPTQVPAHAQKPHADRERSERGQADNDRRPPPRMPDLLRLTAEQAIAAVEGLDREIDFGGGPCEDRKPRGRVVVTTPDPGRRMFNYYGRKVVVILDRAYVCSVRVAPDECAPENLEFETFARHDHGDGEPVGEMLVGVSIKNGGGSACQLRETATLQLRRTDDPDAAVRGSPRRLDVDYRLASGDSVPVAGWWSNWCGARSGNWRVEAEIAGYHGEAHLREPDCEDRDADSVFY